MITFYGPVVNGVNNKGAQDIFISTADPISANGKDGDIWIKYTN
jgi:hypothetical protein